MNPLLLKEITINGHRYKDLNFTERCSLVNTKLYDPRRSDKGIKIFIKKDSEDYCVYVLPLVDNIRDKGLSKTTKLVVYTKDYPQVIDNTFEIVEKDALVFLMSHVVRSETYKDDMGIFIKNLFQKYPWNLF